MLTEAQLHTLKNKLLEQKEENNKVLRGENSEAVGGDGEGNLSNIDNHPADEATEMAERETDAALNKQAEAQNEQIDRALAAMENGTYGICEVSGEEIPYERLELVPETLRCVKHADTELEDNAAMAEEEVLDSTVSPERGDEDDRYDKEDTWEAVSGHGTSQTPSDVPEEENAYSESNDGPDKA
ncbi:TraR/DksA C4-type zinc finger protein [Salibacterium lacus]|uniref:TraR/DksA C4-type zinc finger protein n=1 Tax=Salibacterium lacus TaxID=1898109 RepID=A0ABW5T5U6_9BACI